MTPFLSLDHQKADMAARLEQTIKATRFKAAVGKNMGTPSGILHKTMSVTIEPDSARRKLFTISTEAVDRDNDTIKLAGWQLDSYRKNPVVLWGHNTYAPPIGKTVEIGVVGTALKAVVEFAPADMPVIGEQAEMIFRMCSEGFLSACSVGFIPLEWEKARDRMEDDDWWPALDFTKTELMEWSVCVVPANPEATIADQERAAFIAEQKQTQTAALAEAAAAEATRLREIAEQRRAIRRACF